MEVEMIPVGPNLLRAAQCSSQNYCQDKAYGIVRVYKREMVA